MSGLRRRLPVAGCGWVAVRWWREKTVAVGVRNAVVVVLARCRTREQVGIVLLARAHPPAKNAGRVGQPREDC